MATMTRMGKNWLTTTLTCLLASICFLLCVIANQFGSLKGSLEFLQGKIITAGSIDLEIDSRGAEAKTIQLNLRNLGFHDVTIIGCGMPCFGSPITKMPFDIRAGSSTQFSIIVPPRSGGRESNSGAAQTFQSSITVYTSDVRQKKLDIPIKITTY